MPETYRPEPGPKRNFVSDQQIKVRYIFILIFGISITNGFLSGTLIFLFRKTIESLMESLYVTSVLKDSSQMKR